jgi:iron complex transport system substrate-binding protein
MVIETPVRRMAAATTGCIPFLPMLHIEDALVGLSGCKRVSTPEIAAMVLRKEIVEIGIGNGGMSTALNMEQLYALQPDMVVVYGTGLPEFDHHPKLIEAGFKTVIFASYMEAAPLGRTEWIKFIAAFFDKEEEAERLFDEIASQYEMQAAKVRNPAHRPTVFSAIPYRGLMYVPGGGSYFSGFMADAGADYVWSDDTTAGSVPLSAENVIDRAREADFWLDPGASRSLSELEGMDERFSVFKAFRTGRVYNNDAKVGPEGGNDYWETGEARPDLVLKDLISIFHPDLLPSYERIWYRQLPYRMEGTK